MIIREHHEQFCANTFDKVEEMGKFSEEKKKKTKQYIKRSILGYPRAVSGGGSRLRLAALNRVGNAGTQGQLWRGWRGTWRGP